MEFGDYRFEHFLHGHKDQLEAGGIPPELWGSLYSKLMQQTFDAGNYFRILCEETDEGRNWSVFATRNLHPIDEYNIFLIDHAWTFRPQQAREQLEEHPQLVDRMARLLDIATDDEYVYTEHEAEHESDTDHEITTTDEQERKKVEEKMQASSEGNAPLPRLESVDARLCSIVQEDDTMIDAILRKMWQYIQTYTVRFKPEIDEEGMPVWYIMDEFGVRISHSDTPNVRVVPLYFIPHNAAYSVVFLTKEVADGEEICRDYADNILARRQPEWRRYLMMPWLEKEFELEEEIERQPPDENFFISGRTLDALPTDADQQLAVEALKKRDLSRPLRIYADGLQMIESLSEVKYEEVCNWRDADVLWLKRHFREYDKLCTDNPAALVNQFPHESCLTVKDLLSAILMDQNGGEGPVWYQTCFNLNTELPLFVSYFLHRKAHGLENIWIIKPWNLARGMDMFVSNDLRQIIRLTESGPKIACKYVEHPVLFPRVDNQCRVKFDLRYIVFVTRVRPLRAYVYNNFWIRFALNEFSLHRLDDVNTHFTVFNYGDDTKVLQMECPKFIKHVEAAHTCIKWANVQKQINQVLRNALDAACHWDPPRGMAKNAQSRAMYGADVMLKWSSKEEKEVQPTLLEFNFMPDCERAINYYPDFADTVFRTLFLNDINPKLVTEI
uniref:Tubulin--tyrosine ligase-like protein 12 n=1 Tax=Haemonchus contortus TaxID=6289 RepID=A0A7I4Y2L1_HAECO